MLIHIIADFGQSDLAFAEVSQRFKVHFPNADLILTTVPPFSTLAAGFCSAQLALNDAPKDTFIFHNVAPRKDNLAERKANDGERLVCAHLENGMKVIGVHAGYSFSFLKGLATFQYVGVASHGSQFRSRDLFPSAFAHVVKGKGDALAEPLDENDIPDIPDASILYIDGFGNMKTSLRTHPHLSSHEFKVKIGNVQKPVYSGEGNFSVPEGFISFSPGSSGWQTPKGEVRFYELFLRGGSAYEVFERPNIGDNLTFSS